MIVYPPAFFKGGVSVTTPFLVVWVCPCETTITSDWQIFGYTWFELTCMVFTILNWIAVYVKSQSVALYQYQSYMHA